jgi:hypothetical protein
MATCKTNGHLWGVDDCCIFCKTPRPKESSGEVGQKLPPLDVTEKEINMGKFLAQEAKDYVHMDAIASEKYAELCSELECRERQLSQCLSREKSLAEALEKAVSTMAHWISCIKTRPSDEWEAHGSIDFSGCVCGIKEARAALKSYEEEHSGK